MQPLQGPNSRQASGTRGHTLQPQPGLSPISFWNPSPALELGTGTHMPTGARDTTRSTATASYRLQRAQKKKMEAFSKQYVNNLQVLLPAGFFFKRSIEPMVISSYRQTPSTLRPKTYRFAPETGPDGVHQFRLRAALSTRCFSSDVKYSFICT